MNKLFQRYAGIGRTVALGVVMSQCQWAWAGWTGNVNGTGYGWAQSSVTSVTSNSAVAMTATNVATRNPSAAISPATGYIATATLPNGASATTYSKTLTGTGYRLQNSTVAAGGDKTDDPLLSTTGSQFMSATYLEVLGYSTFPSYCDTNTVNYVFYINTVGTDSGAAQLVRILDLTQSPVPFNPDTDVIVPSSDPGQLCWNRQVNDEGGTYIQKICVDLYGTGIIKSEYQPFACGGEGEGAAAVRPNSFSEGGCLNFFNNSGGWQGQDQIYAFCATPDSRYLFIEFHGTAASRAPGPGDTLNDANFNGQDIAPSNTVWFSSVLKPKFPKLPANRAVTISFINQMITRLDGLAPISVPDAQITFDPNATCVTTVYDYYDNLWVTVAPMSKVSGDTFLSGAGVFVPGGLPGKIKNVTWTGTFMSDTAGVEVEWHWGAAAYTQFNDDPNALGVKATDDNKSDCNFPNNSDKAGTPEAYKAYLSKGARSGGGSNFTGGSSGSVKVRSIPVW